MSSRPAAEAHAGLRGRLDELAVLGADHIRASSSRRALLAALPSVPWLLAVVPGLLLFVQLVQTLHGDARYAPAWWQLIIATLLVPAVAVLLQWLLGRGADVTRLQALGLFDDRLDGVDRLTTADAFLSHTARSDFMEAAIVDATQPAADAFAVDLALDPVTAPPAAAVRGPVAFALVASVLVLLLGQHAAHGAGAADEHAVIADAGDARPSRPVEPPSERVQPNRRPEADDAEPDARSSGDPGGAKRAAVSLKHDAKKTEGKTGAGQTSAAESMSGTNDARGQPTNQGPSSKAETRKPSKPNERPSKKKDAAKPQPPPEKSVDEQSGATAGKGSSKGSNKNPVATSWKSKDDVAPDEEDDIEDDDEVDDEESDQEARGGMQPNLRDRRPPVSRDLTIGFGNQPNPDANGRGGPSQQKKSRGTASLVLGVPIPDRIKGQPNPGRTKVTQERVQPRREDTKPVTAEPRAPRKEPVGAIPAPDLSPWLKDLVRKYFLALRANGRGES